MSSCYTQFSCQLQFKYDVEKEWWIKAIASEEALNETDEDHIRPCVFNIEPDGVWFCAEESGDPYEVGCMVHKFFKELYPNGDDEFVITWADTCGKMALDGFGGGTVVANKDGVGVCGYDSQADFARQNIKSI